MIDKDGIERPDDPNAHMVESPMAPVDKEIDENYNFINKNIFFRIWSRLLRRVGIIFLGPWIKRRYRLKIVGKENIKLVRRKGVMVTVNHVHNFDNVLVGSRLLRHRKCYFITLKDNINMPFLGFMLRSLGGIPIPTNRHAMPMFENTIDELLKKKKAIIICPEASLWPYYRGIRPFKKGAFRFAARNDVPVLPVVISFRRKLRKKQAKRGKIKYKYYFTVFVGKPLYADENLKGASKVMELSERTHKFYEDTMNAFYAEEEKLEQEYQEHLIKKSKKIARTFNKTDNKQ